MPENSGILIPFLYALIAGGATLVGLVLTLHAKHFVKKYSFAIVSLAAGVLLGTAFLHILPEASELIEHEAYLWLLVGFAAFFILEVLIGSHGCHGPECHDEKIGHHHRLGSVASAGIFFHSLIDGVAIAVGFEVNPTLGLVTALAVMVHELPEGIFTLSILIHSGMKKSKAIWWTVVVALATPVGALITLLLFPNLSEKALGVLLAIAAGSFVYISASDLIPESHKSRSTTTGAFVIFGIIIMLLISSLGHGH